MVSGRVKISIDKLQLAYKVGRFGFSTGLLVLLLSARSGLLDFYSLLVLGIYSLVSLSILTFSRKTYLYEFLLDELFLFLLLIKGVLSYTIFSLFLFFPIFFSTIFLDLWQGVAATTVALFLHLVYYFFVGKAFNPLQSFLNFLALTLVFLVSIKVKESAEEQRNYLSELERIKRESEFYRRLYEISSNLAHELKNPLASIKGALQLLTPSKENERLFKILISEVERLDRIIKDFLNLSRPLSKERRKVNVKHVLEELCRNIPSRKECRVEGEEVQITTDPQGLLSALENLIRNALYWAKGKVLIRVEKNRNFIVIRIEDDGPGIPVNERERVFEPFYSRRSGGSGLGLPIVKKFAVESGGFIFVEESSLGGAAFILKLPIEGSGESSNS